MFNKNIDVIFAAERTWAKRVKERNTKQINPVSAFICNRNLSNFSNRPPHTLVCVYMFIVKQRASFDAVHKSNTAATENATTQARSHNHSYRSSATPKLQVSLILSVYFAASPMQLYSTKINNMCPRMMHRGAWG